MTPPRVDQVRRKVSEVGAARCDICESVVAECVELRSGFFGAFPTYLCKRCLRLILEEFFS